MNAYEKRACKAIVKYIRAAERSLAECAQEFAPAHTAYVTFMYEQALRARAGVYRRPPGEGPHGARNLANLTREDVRRLCGTHSLPLLFLKCEDYVLPEDAVYVCLAVLAARKVVAKVERREFETGKLEHMRDTDSPEYEADVVAHLWEQLHNVAPNGSGGDAPPLRPAQVPYVRAVLAGKRMREAQRAQAARRPAGRERSLHEQSNLV